MWLEVAARRCALALAMGLLATSARAAEKVVRPAVPAVLVEQPPVIDGRLDDACWQQASHVDGFVFPVENRPGTEPTEAWVCLDEKNLYAAIAAHDSRPESILANITQRQAALDRDDFVALLVDPSGKGVERYSFALNPRGTQRDDIPQLGSDNYAWKGVWRGAAQRVADGYTVEMAVPLSMLRYPNGQTRFGLGFLRNLEREEEQSFWPPMADRYESHKLGWLEPLHLAPRRGRTLFMPYALGRLGGDPALGLQAGLDVRRLFGNGVMGLATINPDFRSIEDVVDSIAFSYTARRLAETRPFFAEGSGFFPGGDIFYSRQLPDLIAGLKAYGRVGRQDIGLLATWSDRGRLDSAARYHFRLTDNASASAGLVWRDLPDKPTNAAGELAFDWYEPMGTAGLSFSGDWRRSQTNGPGGDGHAWETTVDYGGNGHLGGWLSYRRTDPDFTAFNGFRPEPDRRGWDLGLHHSLRSQEQFIQSHSWSVFASEYTRSDGHLLSNNVGADGYVRLRGGYSANLWANLGQRPPHHDWTLGGSVRWLLDSAFNEGGLQLAGGRRASGDYLYAVLDQGWQFADRLLVNLRSEVTWRGFERVVPEGERSGFRTQNLLTASYRLSDYSALSARFVERSGDLNVYLAFRLSPLSGQSLALLAGDPNASTTRAQVQAKAVWPVMVDGF